MGYTQITLGTFLTQVSDLLDDTTNKYWTTAELTYYTWEGLRVFGALTNFWRTRGTITVSAANGSPFYDLGTLMPTLRTRTWTLTQMVQEVQYMLLENPGGISGTGMSGQLTISSILSAIQDARNRFARDAHIPYTYHAPVYGTSSGGGLISFPQSSVYVHRVSWQDQASGAWSTLWRDDAWGADKNNPLWTTELGTPQAYSEAELAPLSLQLIPPPLNAGQLDALTVDSLTMNLASGSQTFSMPDEWVHAIKYAALSQILSSEGMIKDPVRAQYAESRYQQAVTFAQDARSVIRTLLGSNPIGVDAANNIDSSLLYWRNRTGAPTVIGLFYDMLMIAPGIQSTSYTLSLDVSQSAPIPLLTTDFIPVGEELLDSLKNYVCHVAVFKCGGQEFKDTMGGYDEFMGLVSRQKGVNAAKIKYLAPLFAQPQVESALKPDYTEVKR